MDNDNIRTTCDRERSHGVYVVHIIMQSSVSCHSAHPEVYNNINIYIAFSSSPLVLKSGISSNVNDDYV